MNKAPQHQVRDPVCGMWIDPADAVGKAEHDGDTYYFCHDGCREWFQADPSRYVGPGAARDEFDRHHSEGTRDDRGGTGASAP